MKTGTRACVIGAMLLFAGMRAGRANGDEPAVAAAAQVASAPVIDPAAVARHYREVLARPPYQEVDESTVNSQFEDELSRWFRRLGKKIGDFKYSSRMPAFESLLMTLLVVFSLALLIYIMARLTRRRGRMDVKPSEEIPGAKAFRAPESYDEEIQEAIRAGDWHSAWLATWRQFLSRLENRRLVDADRTRTNREYLAQLRAQALPASALALLAGTVDAYDRFIYGRKSIGQPDWALFQGQIDEAGLLLHLENNGLRARPREQAS